MRLKPAAGLKVRDHVTRQLLPAAGIDVADTDGIPSDPCWQRLLHDRDVVVCEAPPTQEAAPLPRLAGEPTHAETEQPSDGS